MNLLGVKKVQLCYFMGTAPVTSCCTPKGTILSSFVCVTWLSVRFPGLQLRPSPALS